jgi:Butirosin biosynthesis protein H, N-terminal/Domain of unknown function (DUF4872)
MTERKALKKLVRERMSRTGESYTTARRHVLAKAGSSRPPAGVVSGYDGFGARWHRESALVSHLLGNRYSEPMIAGLAGGIGFMYMVFDYEGLPPMLTIVAQHHPEPWASAALGRLGVPVSEEHSGKPVLAVKKLLSALDSGQPVMCTVDRSRLPWHGLEPGFGMDPYRVVVAGRDGDDLLVDDDSVQPNRIGVDAFAEAWSAHKKGRHHMLTLAGPPPADPDLPAAIRAAVATTVAHLTGPVLGNNFDVNFGFSGMAKLSTQLRDQRTKTGWLKRFGAPVPFYHGVRRLYECLELEYTAPGATRPVYAAFLDEAAPLVSGDLAEVAELFRQSGATWSRLAALALETTSSLGEYAEVAERRLEVMCSRGSAAADEIRELTVRLDTLAAEHAATDPLGDTGRLALFNDLATHVDDCLTTERQAVELLTAQSG